MQTKLYLEGFYRFNGVTYSETVKAHLTDIKNYSDSKNYKESINSLELSTLSTLLVQEIVHGLPDDIQHFIASKTITWGATSNGKGFSLRPHSDYVWGVGHMPGACANIVLWLCPEKFEGREFIYGRTLEETGEPYPPYEWGDANLVQLGEIKPATGMGILLDRVNPKWWHGVKELKSDHRVITITGQII